MNTSASMNTQQLAMAKRQLDIDRRQLEIERHESDIAAAKVAARVVAEEEANKKLLLTELERNKVAAVTAENYELAISIRNSIAEILHPAPRAAPGPGQKKTLGWTNIRDYTAYCGKAEGKVVEGQSVGRLQLEQQSLGYGGYITKGGLDAWIRVQTTDPNDLLKNMSHEAGSAVYISPGADIELLKMSGFEIVWASCDDPTAGSLKPTSTHATNDEIAAWMAANRRFHTAHKRWVKALTS